jgi:hypothetical protein
VQILGTHLGASFAILELTVKKAFGEYQWNE